VYQAMDAHTHKKVSLLWTLIFIWLSIDISYSFVNGMTLKLRLSGYLYGRVIFYKNKFIEAFISD